MPLNHLQTLTGHKERVWTLAWNKTGTILASSGSDKAIRLWALSDGRWTCSSILVDSHEKSIRRLAWSPCGQFLASASFDSTVCIWKKDITSDIWSTVVNLEGHENEVKSVVWSNDGKFLASCGRDRTIWIWERSDMNDDPADVDNAENWDCSDVKNDHSKDVKHLAWHPKHNILASCSYDDTVKLFHLEDSDWKCYETLSSHNSTVWSISFSETGQYLASCGDDKSVRIWRNEAHDKMPQVEPRSWKCVSVIQGIHSRTIYDISWSKCSGLIASASGDNSVALYDISTEPGVCDLFTCIEKFAQAHDCDVNCVEWNPVIRSLLASGSDDCTIKLWEHSNENTKGTAIATIARDAFARLSDKFETIEIDGKSNSDTSPDLTLKITGYAQLQDLVEYAQSLQHDLSINVERHSLEQLFDLKITAEDIQPVGISNLTLDGDKLVEGFTLDIADNSNKVSHKIRVNIDKTKFRLVMPKRSGKILSASSELFLIEKTGYLFKLLKSGSSQFLLGHLFVLSDVKIITSKNSGSITYLISVDRDEKIRISNYPKTYIVERYCFGHEHLVKRLILVDDRRFLSIDQSDTVCLWDLARLSNVPDDQALKPERVEILGARARKRCCVRQDLA